MRVSDFLSSADVTIDAAFADKQKLLEDLALQRIPAEVARNGLEMLSWGDRALHHAWRLAESLRIAAGGQSTAVLSATHDRGGSR